jgi:hypothetical protein
VTPAAQFATERLGQRRWHQVAGEYEAPSAIRNPPRFRGKPNDAAKVTRLVKDTLVAVAT